MPALLTLDRFLLFHELLNFRMQNNPTMPMFAYVDDQTPDHPVTEITFLEFGRATHRVAHALRPARCGGYEGQVVILIANCDTVHYHAVAFGMIVAGLVPFFVSHRNSADAVVHMMKKCHCSRIVTLTRVHGDLIEDIRKEISGRDLVVDELPPFSYVFPKLGKEVKADLFAPYPAPRFRPNLDSPSLYFHSSGSTGFPKPIALSHRSHLYSYRQSIMQDLHKLCAFNRIGVMGLPPFHAYGMSYQTILPLCSLATACVFAPRAVSDPHALPIVPTSDNVLDCVRWTGCKVLMSVPIFVEQWALSQEKVDELRKLDLVLCSGGPLTEKVGDDLCAAGAAISTAYGGTEFGCPVNLRTRSDIKDGDWNWMRFSDDIKVRWVPHGDNTYECQVLSSQNHIVAIENIPDVRGYATSDLFIKHPTKNLWKIVGRVDDVIVLASGEKTVPTPMEDIINSSPFVRTSVMFGRERNMVGILVEPQDLVDVKDHNAISEFRNKIWPLVDQANKTAPAFSRIFKDMILIASSDKPFLRTPKGTVRKKVTITAYGAEIDALYDVVETTWKSSEVAIPSTWTAVNLAGWLLQHANVISRGYVIDPKTDLFSQGFDSLSVTYLRNQLVTALRASPDTELRDAASRISLNIVFENPTIERLATRIASLVDRDGLSWKLDINQKLLHITAIDAMINKHSVGLPRSLAHMTCRVPQDGTSSEARTVVLLTGSTGGLGSFLLAQLVDNPAVEKVYAFNRPSSSSSAERQRLAFIDKGISVDLLKSDKLVFIEADASQNNCGLSPALYEELQELVTTIIHNAWRLDFNLSLPSFESNVQATRNLVDLGLDSRHSNSLRFVFTSSIAAAQSWNHEQGAFPEEPVLDSSCAVGSGYGEAKYVCERIIVRSGLHATSLRIGQIASGPNGSWATTDWVPILVKSSIALGVLPSLHGVVSWMRADEVASSILDVAFVLDAPQSLNILNPQRPPWTQIMSSIRDAILERHSLTSDQLGMVSLADWFVLLEKRANNATSEDLVGIPAIKLLDFFRGMARYEELTQSKTRVGGLVETGEAGGMVEFSTVKARHISKSMERMQPVGEADAHAWVSYWTSVGLL